MKLSQQNVFQANKFTESRQTYTVQEKRLLSTIIARVKDTDLELISYSFSVSELSELFGVSGSNLFRDIDKITDKLMSKVVAIKDPDNQRFHKYQILTTASYENGHLTIKINSEMNNVFLGLRQAKQFTYYELGEFLTLTSFYAQRIYELLKQYQHSKQKMRTIQLDDLRMMLGAKDKYPEYKSFRTRVLTTAYKQINEKTNLRYLWEPIKTGRKVTAIRFYDIQAGKNTPTRLQEQSFLDSYIGEECYNEKYSIFITVKEIHRDQKNDEYLVVDRYDGTGYIYSLQELQKGIAYAKVQKKLL